LVIAVFENSSSSLSLPSALSSRVRVAMGSNFAGSGSHSFLSSMVVSDSAVLPWAIVWCVKRLETYQALPI
jgi:hypothetical protein